jgi:GTP-binding protein EngB required for normal cell division
MSSSLDYGHLKTEIEKTGNRILRIAQSTNNNDIVEFLDELLDKLPKEEFYLAMLGLFKRGKSTLINAILGGPILPSGVIPVTSVITRIRYGNGVRARISFSDGSEKEVLIDELPQYVTEARNPDNAKNVTIADVYVPAPILKDGLILIDTPGVGSTHLGGTKTTFQFLDRADFAVLVLAVDPPVGQQELELLSTIASKPDSILFVLNKIDYVDSAAVNESLQYCQKVISEHLGPNIGSELKIYPLSAKLALEGRLHCDTKQIENSGIEQFEAEFKKSIINEKQNLILKSTSKKLQKAVSDLTTFVQLEIKSLTTPLDELVHLQLEFEQYLNLVQQRKRELFHVLEGRTKEIIRMIDEDLAVFKKEHEEIVVKNVEAFVEERFMSKNANSRKIVRDAEDYLRKTLIDTYAEFIKSEDRKIKSRFQQLANEANEKMNGLIGDIKQKVAQLFGFQAINVNFNASLSFETRFYYHLDPIFMTGITFSGGEIAELLPKSLVKGVLKKRIQERARSEFDKNGGRIRYDYFLFRIDQAVLKLKRDINQALDSTTETVKHAVQEAKRLKAKSKLEVKSKADELRGMLVELESFNTVFWSAL